MDTRRFAILEHHFEGVHWDFLVEDGAVLRTWAMEVPLIEGSEIVARALPDHRRIYLNYEGKISGDRGSVTCWDSGVCEVLDWSEDQVRLIVDGSQISGLVEFRCRTVDGDRRWFVFLGKFI